MIGAIRARFIRIALLSLALAMVLVTTVVNVANWLSVRAELRETLSYLANNDGRLTDGGGPEGPNGPGNMKSARQTRALRALYESRYFSVVLTRSGEYRVHDMSPGAEYEEEELIAMARRALSQGRADGLMDEFAYLVTGRGENGKMVVFLNCETRLGAVRSLALISAAACVGGIALAWLLVALVSRRAIQPLIRSAEQQKQFITDAGHELKTPITVIGANMDVLKMEVGENEWIQSTQKQVANLRALVGEMVFLSRLDESDARLQKTALDLSLVTEDVAAPFAAMADFGGKAMAVSVQPGISVEGDEAALRRLISVLCDNAVKYAPEGDQIAVRLLRRGRHAVLETENRLRRPMTEEERTHLFDRFYRADPSRAKEEGNKGYGIGLAIAKAVAEKHGAALEAEILPTGRIVFRCSF